MIFSILSSVVYKFYPRTIYRAARFGGTCVEESLWKNIDSKHMVLWQTEDCILCKEHCNYNNPNIIDWPLIKYPGKDRKCVGYCPSKNEFSRLDISLFIFHIDLLF